MEGLSGKVWGHHPAKVAVSDVYEDAFVGDQGDDTLPVPRIHNVAGSRSPQYFTCISK